MLSYPINSNNQIQRLLDLGLAASKALEKAHRANKVIINSGLIDAIQSNLRATEYFKNFTAMTDLVAQQQSIIRDVLRFADIINISRPLANRLVGLANWQPVIADDIEVDNNAVVTAKPKKVHKRKKAIKSVYDLRRKEKYRCMRELYNTVRYAKISSTNIKFITEIISIICYLTLAFFPTDDPKVSERLYNFFTAMAKTLDLKSAKKIACDNSGKTGKN